jgi:hypothetical protein
MNQCSTPRQSTRSRSLGIPSSPVHRNTFTTTWPNTLARPHGRHGRASIGWRAFRGRWARSTSPGYETGSRSSRPTTTSTTNNLDANHHGRNIARIYIHVSILAAGAQLSAGHASSQLRMSKNEIGNRNGRANIKAARNEKGPSSPSTRSPPREQTHDFQQLRVPRSPHCLYQA